MHIFHLSANLSYSDHQLFLYFDEKKKMFTKFVVILLCASLSGKGNANLADDTDTK